MRADDLRRTRLAGRLGAWVRPAYVPVLEEGDGAPFDNKLGGAPFGGESPSCKKCKRPMALLLQLDIASLPDGSPVAGEGFLQVFHCGQSRCESGDMVYAPGGSGVALRLLDKGASRSKASSKKKTSAPGAGRASRIVGWTKTTDVPSAGDLDDPSLDQKEMRLIRERACSSDDKLGGYPSWIQNPRPSRCPTCGQPMSFVAQLSARIVDFGDSGLAYVAQCAEHPRALSFCWSST